MPSMCWQVCAWCVVENSFIRGETQTTNRAIADQFSPASGWHSCLAACFTPRCWSQYTDMILSLKSSDLHFSWIAFMMSTWFTTLPPAMGARLSTCSLSLTSTCLATDIKVALWSLHFFIDSCHCLRIQPLWTFLSVLIESLRVKNVYQ